MLIISYLFWVLWCLLHPLLVLNTLEYIFSTDLTFLQYKNQWKVKILQNPSHNFFQMICLKRRFWHQIMKLPYCAYNRLLEANDKVGNYFFMFCHNSEWVQHSLKTVFVQIFKAALFFFSKLDESMCVQSASSFPLGDLILQKKIISSKMFPNPIHMKIWNIVNGLDCLSPKKIR